VRVLVDYRPALRQRTGVGEYTHQLVKALAAAYPPNGDRSPLDLTIFSSSWKDRLTDVSELRGMAVVDRRVPVRLLNFAWHRLGWPPADALAGGTFDVTHSSHPLLLPSRRGARVITIHDLNFLKHPERTQGEIRRDYPALVGDHARRADMILTPSQFSAGEIERLLGVPRDRMALCPPGAPDWAPRAAAPADGYVLFVGTMEPRKNLGVLLDAYERLLARAHGPNSPISSIPPLVVAGKPAGDSNEWVARMQRQPLASVVRLAGYVAPDRRRELYAGARLLVQPSLEEGFGIPVLEAMTVGVPVVASNRGSLPEVLGDAGLTVDPDKPDDLAKAIATIVGDQAYAAQCGARGIARSRNFSWERTARAVYHAYEQAIEHAHRR
jgi:glycosyltransferase involved in cell wall biosynthesis